MIGFVENAFINKTLEHVLDGNKGSNILTAILVPVLGAKLDWAKAIRGFSLEKMDDAMEAAKLTGLVVVAVFGYFVGRKKKEPAAK